MPRNIVICCDGTGNEFEDCNTNVVKLYSTLLIDDTQIGYYHPGVGTMGAPTARNRLERWWTQAKGLAFGAGLMSNVGDAYRYLMNTCQENDRIFLFGFSRGAYTARAIAAMLHMFGLLYAGNEGLIPYITRQFIQRSRRQGKMAHTFEMAAGFKATFSRDVRIHFVGVWDTVSSVGWIANPIVLPYSARNPVMVHGRQAVSIDERRCYFRDNLWGTPFQKGDSQYEVDQDIKQVWFPGVHCDVGGGYPEAESGLSKVALEWMLREALLCGLKVDVAKAISVLGYDRNSPKYAAPSATAQVHESLRGIFWRLLEYFPHRHYDKKQRRVRWRIPLGRRRYMPEGAVLHQSVVDRRNAGVGYDPKNLPKQFATEPWIPIGQRGSATAG